MLGQLLRSRRQRIESRTVQPGKGACHRHHPGRSISERAGLVKGDLAHGGQPLQRVALPHQKAVPGRVADGRHDGRGCRQHQRAGAEHHQNRDRADNLARNQPRERRGGQGDDHNPGGPAVRQPHDARLARISGLHQADHTLDGAVLSYLGGPHLKGPILVDRAAGHFIPHRLVHGQRFAGHHRLIDGGLTGGDHAVDGDALARQHAQPVAHPDLLGGHNVLTVRKQQAGCLRSQVHQLFDAGPRAGHGHVLQQRAQLHDEGHLARGEVLPDEHRSDQRKGHQHVGLDVKGRDQADERFQHDGYAAEHDGHPRRVERQGQQVKDTHHQRHAGDGQQRNFLFDATPFQKSFRFLHQRPHKRLPQYTYRGIPIL